MEADDDRTQEDEREEKNENQTLTTQNEREKEKTKRKTRDSHSYSCSARKEAKRQGEKWDDRRKERLDDEGNQRMNEYQTLTKTRESRKDRDRGEIQRENERDHRSVWLTRRGPS